MNALLKQSLFLQFLFIAFSISLNAQSIASFNEQALFINDTNGYPCYRIPAIVKAANGDLLAIAEGRKNGCGDFGDVDILMRSSSDNGKTWSPQKVIADFGNLQAGNPCPVLDELDPAFPNGRLLLFYNTGIADEAKTRNGKGLREVLYISSTDHGKTWSAPENITAQVHKPNRPDLNPTYNFKEDWRTHAVTPGHALQIKRGQYKGRLFIPANHSKGPAQDHFQDYRAYAFYSDDHGKTWQISEDVNIPSSNESIAVELSDGSILQNIRYQSGEQKNRLVATSKNGGQHWDTVYVEKQLPDPVCQASIIDYITPKGKRVLLFSNPNSQKAREKMTVRVSYDDGKTWLIKRQIRSGASAYSDLVICENNEIGLLYEHGNDDGIFYAQFNYDWLISDTESPNPWVKLKPFADEKFELAKPLLTSKQILFTDKTSAELTLDYKGTNIHYTLDGTDPTQQSPRYQSAIAIDKSCQLKAKAFHPQCKASAIVNANFVKAKLIKPLSVELLTAPSQKYPGKGATALFDLQKGSFSYSDDAWMGFGGNDVEALFSFENNTSIKSLTISVLNDPGSWIFGPKAIAIYSSNDNKKFEKIHETNYPPISADSASELLFLKQEMKPHKAKYFKVIVKNTGPIPDWHPGKGTPAWLFIDEIIVE